MIQFIKDNEWIFWVFGAIVAIITLFISLRSGRVKRRESNKKTYEDVLQSDFHDLFEFDAPRGFSLEQLNTDGFDLTEIAAYCFRVINFKEEGNVFKGLCTRYRFHRLYILAKEIYSYTDSPDYLLSIATDPFKKHMEIYNSNPRQFKKLKKRFKRLYLRIFDHL
jgi:hypothetical protein